MKFVSLTLLTLTILDFSAKGSAQILNDSRQVLVISGMTQESGIAKGPGVVNVLSGGDLAILTDRLQHIDPKTIRAVVSFGVAGALDPRLTFGDVVVSSSVTTDTGEKFATDSHLSMRISTILTNGGLKVYSGPMYSTTVEQDDASGKLAIFGSSGAISVDMESNGAAEFASKYGLPLVVLRTISDPQTFTLPSVVKRAINPDGTLNISEVIGGLLAHPSEISALVTTAEGSERAFHSLRVCRMLVNLGSL